MAGKSCAGKPIIDHRVVQNISVQTKMDLKLSQDGPGVPEEDQLISGSSGIT